MAKGTRLKQHHYVPQFYLRGFLGTKKQLYVVDRSEGRVYYCPTLDVGGEKYYNLVNSKPISPFAVEDLYSDMEGEMGPALERVKVAKSLANAEDRALVMQLIASTALRNPSTREGVGNIVEALTGEKASKELNIAVELEHQGRLAETLGRRKWRVVKAAEGTGGFITTDDPVNLRWSDGVDRPLSPGFAVAETEVIFPISPGLALRGTFEGEEDVVEADTATVATINSLNISNARNQIYARDFEFKFMRTPAEGLGSGAILIDDKRFLAGGDAPEENKIVPLKSK